MGVNWMLCPLPLMLVVPATTTPFCEMCRAPGSEPPFIGALVNRVITVLKGTKVAPLLGRMLTTVGAAFRTAGVVVNWLIVSARAFPERSVIRWVAATVMVAPAGKVELVELRITVRLSREMEVAGLSGTSPFSRLTLLALIVAGLMDFENVSTTCVFKPALVTPFAGLTVTVGGVLSAVFAVVKL